MQLQFSLLAFCNAVMQSVLSGSTSVPAATQAMLLFTSPPVSVQGTASHPVGVIPDYHTVTQRRSWASSCNLGC